MTDTPALVLKDLHAWYGNVHVLRGVNLTVPRGEAVALLGRNGAGRTTTLRAIMGLRVRRSGSIQVNGTETIGLPPHRIARLGAGYCPEERGIFASLSCEENLLLPPDTPVPGGQAMTLADIYQLFPNLEARRQTPGTRLSGGEQQMLALARILRTQANLLLLDEVSEGLAPVIIEAMAASIAALKTRGYSMLLIEQNFPFAAALADRFYVMENGAIVDHFSAAELGARETALIQRLGV
ncbi:ABC transporter ATP-binding protein [Kerstersia similis]|uniref:ABC transporter ATP-binding protein n=1 Tax=Kerstersia similis TaxID=206505 RepID=UPI0039EE3F2C